MTRKRRIERRAFTLLIAVLAASACSGALCSLGQKQPRSSDSRPVVLIDTDIGDDIDDVFAVGLGLSSSDVNIAGISAGWGDTALRARLLDRLLATTGQRQAIEVAQGAPKHHAGEAAFSQAPWAMHEPARGHVAAADFILDTVRKNPGQVTIVELAPMTNLADALAKDPSTFRQIKRIVAMGGSVRSGYVRTGGMTPTPPGTEYNVMMDPEAAAAVLGSGVPLYLMPLDSTQLKLDEVKRTYLFTRSTPLTDAFAVLYPLWSSIAFQQTPTLYDAVAMAYALDPDTCPATPLRISFTANGDTREEQGAPNSWVCLRADEPRFFALFLGRLGAQHLGEPPQP